MTVSDWYHDEAKVLIDKFIRPGYSGFSVSLSVKLKIKKKNLTQVQNMDHQENFLGVRFRRVPKVV